MQRIAGIFDEHNFIRRHKADVVKSTMCGVAPIKHRELPLVAGRRQRQLHDRPEASIIAPRLGPNVRITGFVKIELSKVGPRTELPVFWTLEWRGTRVFRKLIRIE